MTIEQLATQGREIYSTLAGRQYTEVSRLRNETLKSMFASSDSFNHRQQLITTIKGVKYIDDSKSINTNATWFTFERTGNPIIWILEIEDLEASFHSLISQVKEKVHTLIVVGEKDNKASKTFSGLTNLITVSNLSEAVKMAYYFANEPDVVIYSPANGNEENIEKNANRFLQLVNEL